MNTRLFRKSSIDRVNSPEQLNEYIRVANPGVWFILAAVAILLVGVLFWGIFGTIETTIKTGAVVDGGTAVCYVSEENASRLEAGMAVSVNDVTGSVQSVAAVPVQIGDTFSDYILYLTGFSKGDFCYGVEVELPGLEDGDYAAVITLDNIHPISFVIR